MCTIQSRGKFMEPMQRVLTGVAKRFIGPSENTPDRCPEFCTTRSPSPWQQSMLRLAAVLSVS
eukprot:3436170-Amphidinium_carterae.3